MNGDDRRSRRGFVEGDSSMPGGVGPTLSGRRPGASRAPQAAEVASVGGLDRAVFGGPITPGLDCAWLGGPITVRPAASPGGTLKERGPAAPKPPPSQRSVSKTPGRGPFRGRRPGALRDQQAEKVANVEDLDRAVSGGLTIAGRVAGRARRLHGRSALAICLAAAWSLTSGCTPEEVNADPEAPAADPTVALLSVIGFEPIVDGMSRGFNLDDAVTASASDPGCGRADLVAPDGTPGVDNAFGALLPLITSLGGEALQSLVQNAVLSGELLLLFELDDLEGTPTDSCTSGRVVRGLGQPFLGTDGAILPGQTFDVNELFPSAELSCVRPQADGSVIADGVVLRLPLQVFDEHIDLTLIDGRIQLQPTEGGWTGVIGGGVSIDELAENVFGLDAIPTELEDGVVQAVRLTADLAEDAGGVCQQLSVTLAVDAVPAYLFEDAP